MRPKLSIFSWPLLGCIVCFCFCSALLAAFCLFYFVVSILCTSLLYSAPGWSSGYRLQSEANPAPLAEPKELRFYLPPTYIQGAYEIGSSAVTCGCTGGDGGRGSSRLDHGKISPSRTSPPPPHPVSACLHVRCLVVWLFCCSSPFHVTISLSPSSLSFAHGPLRSFHVFSSSLVFHVFTSVVVGFFGGTTPTSGRSLVFFLFLFHPPWPKSSIKYQVSRIKYQVSDGRLKTL